MHLSMYPERKRQKKVEPRFCQEEGCNKVILREGVTPSKYKTWNHCYEHRKGQNKL